MIRFIRTRFKLVCLICFALTTGGGLLALAWPNFFHLLAGKQVAAQQGGFFFYQFGWLLVAVVGVWFLIIMMNPDANKSLLTLATAEKFLFVAFFLWSMVRGNLSWLFAGVALADLAMGLACLLYLVVGDIKPAAAQGGELK